MIISRHYEMSIVTLAAVDSKQKILSQLLLIINDSKWISLSTENKTEVAAGKKLRSRFWRLSIFMPMIS